MKDSLQPVEGSLATTNGLTEEKIMNLLKLVSENYNKALDLNRESATLPSPQKRLINHENERKFLKIDLDIIEKSLERWKGLDSGVAKNINNLPTYISTLEKLRKAVAFQLVNCILNINMIEIDEFECPDRNDSLKPIILKNIIPNNINFDILQNKNNSKFDILKNIRANSAEFFILTHAYGCTPTNYTSFKQAFMLKHAEAYFLSEKDEKNLNLVRQYINIFNHDHGQFNLDIYFGIFKIKRNILINLEVAEQTAHDILKNYPNNFYADIFMKLLLAEISINKFYRLPSNLLPNIKLTKMSGLLYEAKKYIDYSFNKLRNSEIPDKKNSFFLLLNKIAVMHELLAVSYYELSYQDNDVNFKKNIYKEVLNLRANLETVLVSCKMAGLEFLTTWIRLEKRGLIEHQFYFPIDFLLQENTIYKTYVNNDINYLLKENKDVVEQLSQNDPEWQEMVLKSEQARQELLDEYHHNKALERKAKEHQYDIIKSLKEKCTGALKASSYGGQVDQCKSNKVETSKQTPQEKIYLQAFRLLNSGNIDGAINSYKQAIKHADIGQDWQIKASALAGISDCYAIKVCKSLSEESRIFKDKSLPLSERNKRVDQSLNKAVKDIKTSLLSIQDAIAETNKLLKSSSIKNDDEKEKIKNLFATLNQSLEDIEKLSKATNEKNEAITKLLKSKQLKARENIRYKEHSQGIKLEYNSERANEYRKRREIYEHNLNEFKQIHQAAVKIKEAAIVVENNIGAREEGEQLKINVDHLLEQANEVLNVDANNKPHSLTLDDFIPENVKASWQDQVSKSPRGASMGK